MRSIRSLALALLAALALALGMAACGGEDQFAPGTPAPRFETQLPDPRTPHIDPAAP